MIRTPTTFVIGAGTSVPYGLPVGMQVKANAENLNPNSDWYGLILQDRSISPSGLNRFREELRDHPAESIDGFLDTRQAEKQTIQIGKRVIAVQMAAAMRQVKRAPREEDWLGYLIGKMLNGWSRPKNSERVV